MTKDVLSDDCCSPMISLPLQHDGKPVLSVHSSASCICVLDSDLPARLLSEATTSGVEFCHVTRLYYLKCVSFPFLHISAERFNLLAQTMMLYSEESYVFAAGDLDL